MRTTLVVVLVALLGCGKDDKATGDKAASDDDPGADFIAKSVAEEVTKIKAAIASPTPREAHLACAHVGSAEDIKKHAKHQAIANEYIGLCTKDLPLAILKTEVEAAEAARKEKPDDTTLTNCYNAYYDRAKEDMEKAKTVDLAKDLIARFEAACPPKK